MTGDDYRMVSRWRMTKYAEIHSFGLEKGQLRDDMENIFHAMSHMERETDG